MAARHLAATARYAAGEHGDAALLHARGQPRPARAGGPSPPQSPMGNLPPPQPIFEDPSRVIGKRDYVAGDSLQRVDWKATAVVGRLQVKQYQPSTARETLIVLSLT